MHFYVYALIDPRDNKPYYIGKGCNGRVKRHFNDSQLVVNNPKNEKIKKLQKLNLEPKRHTLKLRRNLSESEAFELEAFVIEEIGLENLTNITAGGKSSLRYKSSKISELEYSWIKWIKQNTAIGAKTAFGLCSEFFDSNVTYYHFGGVWYKKRHNSIKPKKPPFFDKIDIDEKMSIETRYKILEEWLTSWNSAKTVGKRYDIPKGTIVNWKTDDVFGLFSKFKKEYGENYLRDKKRRMLEERYQAYCLWRVKGFTAEQAVTPIEHHTKKHPRFECLRTSD